MRNNSYLDTPTLFTDLSPIREPETIAEKTPGSSAGEFVRWCWNVGSDFRNSPDITNLRFWLEKTGATPTPSEEGDILMEARRLFLKKVEQGWQPWHDLNGVTTTDEFAQLVDRLRQAGEMRNDDATLMFIQPTRKS